ncbi:MAG: hypothetical protein FWH05_05300 [Oscillospiraceae bacterium]|nr:hypothetical protein [Oscillospiraceae bacterium]
MTNLQKKLTAIVLSLTLLLCACADTSYVATIDGQKIAAGRFILAQLDAQAEALEKFNEQYPDANMNQELFDYSNYTLNEDGQDIPFIDWVNNKALERITLLAAYESEFERLELVLDPQRAADVRNNVRTTWGSAINPEAGMKEKTIGEYHEARGISESSAIEWGLSSLKEEAVFEAYYGVDGLFPVPSDEIERAFHIEYRRALILPVYKTDVNGEPLDEIDLAEARERAESYLNSAKGGTSFSELEAAEEDFRMEQDRLLNPDNYAFEDDFEDDFQDDFENDDIILSEGFEFTADFDDDELEEEQADLDDEAEDIPQTDEEEIEETEEDENEDEEIYDENEFDIIYGDEEVDSEFQISRDMAEQLGEELISLLFDELSDDEVGMAETDEAFYIVTRLDISQRPDWLERSRELLIVKLREDTIKEEMLKIAEGFDIQLNEQAIRRYNPTRLID